MERVSCMPHQQLNFMAKSNLEPGMDAFEQLLNSSVNLVEYGTFHAKNFFTQNYKKFCRIIPPPNGIPLRVYFGQPNYIVGRQYNLGGGL